MKWVIVFLLALGFFWLVAKILGGIVRFPLLPVKKAGEKLAGKKSGKQTDNSNKRREEDDFDDYELYSAIDDD